MTTGRELEINLSTLLGLNNRRPDFRLRTKEGSFLRAASNVDISDAGTAKRRAGQTLAVPIDDCHSLWPDENAGTIYFAAGNALYRAKAAATLAPQTLGAAVRGRPLSYTNMGSEVVITNALTNIVVAVDGVIRPLGATAPQAVPSVSAFAGGALRAGLYQVSLAFQNDGREISPATPAVQVDVPEAGGISLSGLPTTWPSDASRLLVYVSATNGNELYLSQTLASPATTTAVTSAPADGMRISTYLLAPLPPGQIVRWHMGRLYVVAGDTVFYSEIYSPGLYAPTKNFASFPAPITVFEPCDDGIFLVADATYWIAGDMASAEARKIAPTRGVLGTGGQDRRNLSCFWMSEQGLAVGTAGGAVRFPQAETIAVAPALSGATTYRESDGQRQVIASLFRAPGEATAAHSYMDAEVIRKGTST